MTQQNFVFSIIFFNSFNCAIENKLQVTRFRVFALKIYTFDKIMMYHEYYADFLKISELSQVSMCNYHHHIIFFSIT